MIDKTVILLIDFEGHPIMGDAYMNELRYACLHGLIYGIPEKPENQHKSFLLCLITMTNIQKPQK